MLNHDFDSLPHLLKHGMQIACEFGFRNESHLKTRGLPRTLPPLS
jgi:hypothetical protein